VSIYCNSLNSFHWRDQTRIAHISSRLLAGRGVTVEQARSTMSRRSRSAICAEMRRAETWSNRRVVGD